MKLSPYLIAAIASALAIAAPAARGDWTNDENRYYNAKLGPIYITFNSSLETEFNDNVTLASGRDNPVLSDIIVSPRLGMAASTELSLNPKEQINRTKLSFSIDFGYRKYLNHPNLDQNLSSINIAPDSQLTFLIRTEAIKIKLYEGLSLQTDPVADGSLSNVSEFRRLVNIIGADTTWNINSLTTARLNLFHRNFWALGITGVDASGSTTDLNTADYDSYTESAAGSLSVRALSFLDLGWSASAESTTYPSASYQDSTTYSYGPTATARLSDYTSLTASTGLTRWQENGTGSTIYGNAGTDDTTHYLNLALNNTLNRYYTHTLSAGRQTSLDLLGAQTQIDYIRYSASWRINSRITLLGGLDAEKISYVGGVHTATDYRLLQGNLSTKLRLSRKLTTAVSYRYTDKTADNADQSYTQNQFIWTLTYSF